jgi:hypothetical protein
VRKEWFTLTIEGSVGYCPRAFVDGHTELAAASRNDDSVRPGALAAVDCLFAQSPNDRPYPLRQRLGIFLNSEAQGRVRLPDKWIWPRQRLEQDIPPLIRDPDTTAFFLEKLLGRHQCLPQI